MAILLLVTAETQDPNHKDLLSNNSHDLVWHMLTAR